MPSHLAPTRLAALAPASLALALGLVVALAPGCGDADLVGEQLQCPADPGPFTLDDSRVTGTVELDAVPAAPLGRGDSVIVRGTANHEDGLAIREILVAGVSATPSVFNFKRWSATLTYEDLALAAPVNAAGQVVVDVVAIDACGDRYPFLQLTLPLDPTPGLSVDSLALTVSYPGERGHLPSDESAAATVTVAATGQGVADAAVTLAATTGRFQGLSGGDRVHLFADGDGGATGTALFYADEPGTAVITALLDDTLTSALVVAAEPPTLAPREATLVPGASLALTVWTQGTLDHCQATPSDSFTIRHGGVEVGAAAAAMSRDPDGAYTLTVEARADAAADASLTITCVDDYGQAGSGTYSLRVADPPASIVVESLAIEVAIPHGRDHLPADGSAPAVLSVSGTGKPANAEVVLSASSGSFEGAPDDTLVLGAAGGSAADSATATALYYPDTPGTVVLTASAVGATATTTVRVVDAPRITPAGAVLLPGQRLDVVVLTDGELTTCQASPSTNLWAKTADGVLIGASPTPLQGGPGSQVVSVGVPEDADDNATIELTCRDLWGQYGDATFSASVP